LQIDPFAGVVALRVNLESSSSVANLPRWIPPSALQKLRASAMSSGFSILLMAPAALKVGGEGNMDMACAYLGLSSAWLATDILKHGGLPTSRPQWLSKMALIALAAGINVVLFSVFAASAGLEAQLPYWLEGGLTTLCAVGLVQWTFLRLRNTPESIILAALIVFSAKIVACVAARLVYGPQFIKQGFVSSDWQTAKLMINTFWVLASAFSLAALLASYMALAPTDAHAVPRATPL
jgi:hypothetical protein